MVRVRVRVRVSFRFSLTWLVLNEESYRFLYDSVYVIVQAEKIRGHGGTVLHWMLT